MSYYRIKIEELNNGEIKYIPQKGYLYTSGGWIKRPEIRWENMYCGPYSRESLALEKIKQYQKIEEEMKGKEVISTSYKTIQ